MISEPFNLPRGSVRAIVVLALIFATATVCILGSPEAALGFVGILGVAVRDYFAHREEQNREAGPPVQPPVQG